MELLTDVRHAARQLGRAPGFSATVVSLLALGVGASAAIVAAADHVLLRPLALPEPERLVTLCEVHEQDEGYCTVSPGNAADWSAARAVAALGIARRRGIEVDEGDRRVEVSAAMATPGFLRALGVAPLHGRLLTEADVPPAGPGSVVVLSHELWQEQYGGDPGVVGRVLRVSSNGDGRVLAREPVLVIGVLPPVDVPRLSGTQAWIPFQFDVRAEEHRGWRGFVGIARLGRGVAPQVAERELNGIEARLAEAYPSEVGNWRVEVHPLRAWVVQEVRPLLVLLVAAAAVVLVIVCVNVVGLLLARTVRRERELAVMAALGAARSRIARQLVLEGVLLAVGGGIAGLALAGWLVSGLVGLAPAGVPRVDEIVVDGRIVAVMLAVTTLIGVVFGLVPGLRLRPGALQDMLRVTRTMTGDRRTQRLRNGLVVGQLALALGLLLSAALLLRSFTRLAAYDPGFELDGALTFWVAPPMWRYETREQRRDYYRRVARELAALPGVVAVGSASAGPLLGGGDGRTPFLVEGATQPAKQDAPTVAYFDAGPGWFPALGVSLRAGRNLSPDASVDGVVEAVVNETMARRHWPGTPVGARVRLPDWEMEAEIVGVVADMRPFGTATEPAIFVSNVQRPRGASFFVVRTGRDPERLVPSVRRVLTGIDPDAPPRQVASLRDLLHEQLVAPRFALLLIGGFAVLSLLLSTAGVYAVIAYAVSLRTREFGIRLALGARAGQVLALVLRDGGRLLAAGLLLGGLVAWFFARLLRGLIHDMAAADITALLLAGAIMTAAALVASAAPALRAARTQPASVLHAE